MKTDEIFSKMFGFSIRGYYTWKKQNRLIFLLLEKYFTNQDLEEFIETGKVSKYDNIERVPEILKLLTKYTTKTLSSTLAKALESNDNSSGTSKRLLSYTDTTSKLNFLEDLERLLLDLSWEAEAKILINFQKTFQDFNKFIGFDFNENDILAIKQIISRYKVYNTLYDLDKS